MSFSFLGQKMQSPLIIGSGPLSYGADGMIALHKAGAGAVVTKTIRDNPAMNPEPHIANLGNSSMINAEEWSDYPAGRWAETEIPRALAEGVCVICSIGHTPEEVKHWLPLMDRAGAPLFELVSYEGETMIPMIREAKKLTDKPVLVKISPNWKDPAGSALEAAANGADGITAMDSLGPVLSIDVNTAKASVAGQNGMGWLTGSAIKPLALRFVAEIASQTEIPIVGLGGVMNGEDALEMVMAGASAVGVCTMPMLKGTGSLNKLLSELQSLLDKLGYESLSDARGAALPYLFRKADRVKHSLVYEAPCRLCGLCIKRCPYQALSEQNESIRIEKTLCRRCGLCTTSCPQNKLKLIL
ncbi:MAG: hypothetical protein PQJ58_20405 [Spirochaetales bacterium]|nr:hypothetical protein [Spirochaetales bacterium]